MDKKDIYEHLANIYLDASSKRKKKKKKHHKLIKNAIFFCGIFCLASAILFIAGFKTRRNALHSEIALLVSLDPAKINFNFNPAKKEIYSVNLNRLDLAEFKELGFSLKKLNYQDNISLRLEFINAFREKSGIYIRGIPHKWQDYRINFSDFKNISDWSQMQNISFAVEEWNTKEKKGIVYIDNVRFIR